MRIFFTLFLSVGTANPTRDDRYLKIIDENVLVRAKISILREIQIKIIENIECTAPENMIMNLLVEKGMRFVIGECFRRRFDQLFQLFDFLK